MGRYASSNAVRDAIVALERQQALESRQISMQFVSAFDSIKPINLIRNTFKDVVESKDLTENIVQTSIGLVAGYVTQSLFQKPSHGPLRKLFGTIVSYGITHFLATNPAMVAAIGSKMLRFFRKIVK